MFSSVRNLGLNDCLVRALAFRFEAFGRPIKHAKKWEEGVFSDLRNLKPGTDACLEEPKRVPNAILRYGTDECCIDPHF